MIDVTKQNERRNEWTSSKGNQMKWFIDGVWYKADYAGYEAFAESVVSQLLTYSNLIKTEFVSYDLDQVVYEKQTFSACKSRIFLPEGWQLITLECLFKSHFGYGLNQSIDAMESLENRIRFIVEQTIRLTQLHNFGQYMSQLLTIDAFFLNEDRNTHNIAVLLDDTGRYHLCPLFDNGATLLSDTRLDYPLNEDVYSLRKKVKSKTFTQNFDEQLDTVEKVYGSHLKFTFTKKDIERIVFESNDYPMQVKQRVLNVLFEQMRKYKYLFR